ERMLATVEPILAGLNVKFRLLEAVGEDHSSVVRKAVEYGTGATVAIKCIVKANLDALHWEALGREIDFLRQLKHPHIISLDSVYGDVDRFYLVTEYMAGGELFDRIVEQSYYGESDARAIVRLILDAVKYCHDHNIVHRNIKPENFFLLSATDNTTVKLGGFGCAALAPDDLSLTAPYGTPSYVAPEIIRHKAYGKPVDIWSLGVVTFILLCGYQPFFGDTNIELFTRIRAGRFDCPDDLSADAQDFLAKMLAVNPAERYTVDQLANHIWLTGENGATAPLPHTLEKLKQFNIRRKFKGAACAVIASNIFRKHRRHGVPSGVKREPNNNAHDLPHSKSRDRLNIDTLTTTHPPESPTRSWFRSVRILPG
ncbi:hypothetical protein As57867_003632, partial [Aphanomyces stellatus]